MQRDRMKFTERFSSNMLRNRKLGDGLTFDGRYKVRQFRNGILLAEYNFHNLVTKVGKNKNLDIMFNSDTQITTWYGGLINNSGYTAVDDDDTAGSHPGWTEWTSYDEAVRQTYNPDAAASQAISNSTPMTFTISATGTLVGLFIISNSTKGGTTGTLWSAGEFSGTIPVVDNDVINVTYNLSIP